MDASDIDLYNHTRHIERLFILGAGFSISASKDFPSTDRLLESLFDEDPDLHNEWAEFAAWYAPFVRARAGAGIPEITSILTALEAHRAIVGKRGVANTKILQLRTRILHAISTLLYRASMNAAGSPVLTDFVNELDGEKDAVLTLNWDIALEEALRKAKKPFQYDVLPATGGLERPDSLLVLKPQGSVTWCRMNPVVSVTKPVLTVPPAPPKPFWTLSEINGPPVAFSARTGTTADPAVITPSFIGEDRAAELDWSGYLLRIATTAALRASKIVVVGYSLPADDFHILAALSFGLPQDSTGDGVEVFVVDPSVAAFNQWHRAFFGMASNAVKPIMVRHWATSLQDALRRRGGPW